MVYLYETERKSYEDYASGRVLFNRQGTTSFPVRLASEIFGRCRAYLTEMGACGPYILYDPCCGGGYLLTVLGFLHGDDLSGIYGSDIDDAVIELAQRNLALLTRDGMDKRIEQIKEMLHQYHKESHQLALESALRLREVIEKRQITPEIKCFQADALSDSQKMLENCGQVDMVIADTPYGNLVDWTGTGSAEEMLHAFLDNLLGVMKTPSTLAVITDTKQRVKHEGYKQVDRFKVGKRHIILLSKKDRTGI